MRSTPIAHDPAELGALEASTGLHFIGYLAVGTPAALVPILTGKRLDDDARRALVRKLNGRELAPVAAGDCSTHGTSGQCAEQRRRSA